MQHMVVYSYGKDVGLNDWLAEYAKKNSACFRNQKRINLRKPAVEKYMEIKDKAGA